MCLGIPGRVVELLAEHEHLALVDVSGTHRKINIGMIEGEGVQPGDWVLIHVGFAMLKLDEAEAAQAVQSLQMMSEGSVEEIEAMLPSRAASDESATERMVETWAS